MTNQYASVAEIKAASDMPPSDNKWDARLEQALDAAAAAIDRFCNRPDGFVAYLPAAARQFGGNDCDYLYLRSECIEVTLVEYKTAPDATWTALAAADWQAFAGDKEYPYFDPPYDGILLTGVTLSSFPRYRVPSVRVTAKWGYSDVCPPQVTEACIAQATRWFKRAQSSYADATASEGGGQLFYRKALDPDIEMMLNRARLVRATI